MSEETMLDRVSKILAEEVSRLMGVRVKADDFGTRPIARAVLEVMREPTQHMSEVGCHEYQQAETGVVDELTQVHTWRSMIDAASQEAGTRF